MGNNIDEGLPNFCGCCLVNRKDFWINKSDINIAKYKLVLVMSEGEWPYNNNSYFLKSLTYGQIGNYEMRKVICLSGSP